MVEEGSFVEEALTASVQETGIVFAEICLMAALCKPILLVENTVYGKGFNRLDPGLMKSFVIPVAERKDFRKDCLIGHRDIPHFGEDTILLYTQYRKMLFQ